MLLGPRPASDFPFENFPLASLDLNAPAGGSYARTRRRGGDASVAPARQPDPEITFSPVPTRPERPSVRRRSYVAAAAGSTLDGPVRRRRGVRVASPRSPTDPDGRVRVEVDVPGAGRRRAQRRRPPEWMAGPAPSATRRDHLRDRPRSTGPRSRRRSADTAARRGRRASPTPRATAGFYNRRMPSLPVNPGHDPLHRHPAPGFISTDRDIDWYRLGDVPAGSRITADLTNLPVDADLVLYGPPASTSRPPLFPATPSACPARWSRTPAWASARPRRPLAAQALARPPAGPGLPRPDRPRPDRNPPSIKLTPLSISQHRGSDAESVGVIAPVDRRLRGRRLRLQRRHLGQPVPAPGARHEPARRRHLRGALVPQRRRPARRADRHRSRPAPTP